MAVAAKPAEASDPAAIAAAEGEGEAVETEEVAEAAPVEGEPAAETTDEEKAAEAEAAKVAEADLLAKAPELFAKLPEAEQRKHAMKFANATMAAARRAETRAQKLAGENESLKAKLSERTTEPDFRADPTAWVQRQGFKSWKELLDFAAGKTSAPTVDTRLSDVEKRIADREKAIEQREQAAAVEKDKQAIAAAVKADATRWVLAAKPTGQVRLWDSIVEYAKSNGGQCPDEAIFLLADAVERDMRSEFGEPAPRQPVTAQPTPGKKGTATTITGKGAAGAPVAREYDRDPERQRKQIEAELRAEGLLNQA